MNEFNNAKVTIDFSEYTYLLSLKKQIEEKENVLRIYGLILRDWSNTKSQFPDVEELNKERILKMLTDIKVDIVPTTLYLPIERNTPRVSFASAELKFKEK